MRLWRMNGDTMKQRGNKKMEEIQQQENKIKKREKRKKER